MSRCSATPEEIVRAGLTIECTECGKPHKPKSAKPSEFGICPACLSDKTSNKGGKSKKFHLHPSNRSVLKKDLQKPRRADTPYAHHHRGYRVIDRKRICFANRMEANYYRYLLWLKKKKSIANFEFQPSPFDFRPFGVDQGIVTYRPDFLVLQFDGFCYYVETKGHMNASSKTKLNRMRKYYPSITLEVVNYKKYKEIERDVGSIIEGWEM